MTSRAPKKRTLTPKEVADQLGVTESFVRKQVRLGLWPSVRLGRRIVFTDALVDRILEASEQPPREPAWQGQSSADEASDGEVGDAGGAHTE